MEKEKPIPNETSQPISPSQADPKAVAKSLLQEGLQVDEIVAQTGLTRPQVYGLQGRLKRQQKSQALSRTTPEQPKPIIEAPSLEEDISQKSQGFPTNPMDKVAYYLKLPPKDAIIQLLKENRMLESQVRNDGHGSQPYYEDAEGELDREMARFVKAKRYQLIMNEGKTETKEDKGIEILLKAIEIVQKMTPQQGKSEVEQALSVMLLNWLKEAKENPKTTTNEYDLKRLEISQEHDLDLLKLKWEMAKYEKGESTTEKLLETIKQVVGSPAISGAVQELGRAAASKISTMKDGQKVTCPNCRATFFANPALQTVQCVNCGAMLAKQPQPGEQTQEPQPQQPIQEQPSQETPQEPKKPDVLDNF
jgi:ribosomal protein S27E